MKKHLLVLTALAAVGCVSGAAGQGLLDELKQYDNEPVHIMRTESADYHYQIFVNDVPVFSKFQNWMTSASFYVNSAILSKGKQTLTIVVYPKTGPAGAQSRLSDSRDFTLTLSKTAWMKGGGGLEEEEDIIEYTLPETTPDGETINYSELESYSQTIEFKANVPYKSVGWAKSRDLDANDPELREQVFAYFEGMKRAFEQKDADTFYERLYGAEKLVYQSLYLTPEQALKQRSSWISYIESGKKMDPLENCEVFIAGNGKLVGLRSTDPAHRGEGALRVSYVNDWGHRQTTGFNILLHKPEGRDQLEAIWFTMESVTVKEYTDI